MDCTYSIFDDEIIYRVITVLTTGGDFVCAGQLYSPKPEHLSYKLNT